jgi:hypothetical protein
MYGLHRRETMSQLDRERKAIADQKEKERLERRQDRKEAAELKLKLAADMKQEQLDHPFRNKRKQ